MITEEKVKDITCRITHQNKQLGSGFWIDEQRLLTASHVVENINDDKLTVQTDDFGSFEVSVERSDPNKANEPGADIALLKCHSRIDGVDFLPVKKSVPPIGTEVMWSGYAKLIGEQKVDRQRFGWGRVASEEYGDKASFFEVDGLFNPYHSGSPVVETSSERIVGIVSMSAGRLDPVLDEWLDNVNDLKSLIELKNMRRGRHIIGYHYKNRQTKEEAKEKFEDLGLETYPTKELSESSLSLELQEVIMKIAEKNIDISERLLEATDRTLQMGVGITSGGKPLANFS